MNNSSLIKFLLLLFVFTAGITADAFAGMGGSMGMGPPPCWPPPCIPIDGGISFLVAAGVVYGGKKMYDQRKKQDQ